MRLPPLARNLPALYQGTLSKVSDSKSTGSKSPRLKSGGLLFGEKTMKLRKNTAGFTLVEIAIVAAIIGLLAVIAVPNLTRARTDARRSACINNLRLINAAKEEYALANNVDTGGNVDAADVETYLGDNVMPVCPSAGTYTINIVGTTPSCSKSATPDLHVLP